MTQRFPPNLQGMANPHNTEKGFNELINEEYGTADISGAITVELETATVGYSTNSFVKVNDQYSLYQQEEKKKTVGETRGRGENISIMGAQMPTSFAPSRKEQESTQ
jgi:hypothetical protein